jgi:hypothetical protein
VTPRSAAGLSAGDGLRRRASPPPPPSRAFAVTTRSLQVRRGAAHDQRGCAPASRCARAARMFCRLPPAACSCRPRDVSESQCSCLNGRPDPTSLQLQLCTARSTWMQALRRRVWSLWRMSRHVTSRHVTSRHVTSRHVTSRHVTSRHANRRCPINRSPCLCSGVCGPSSPSRVLLRPVVPRQSCRGGYITLPLTQRAVLLKRAGAASRCVRSVADPELRRCRAAAARDAAPTFLTPFNTIKYQQPTPPVIILPAQLISGARSLARFLIWQHVNRSCVELRRHRHRLIALPAACSPARRKPRHLTRTLPSNKINILLEPFC